MQNATTGSHHVAIAEAAMVERELLTVGDVAKMLRVSSRSVWRMKSRGEIPEPVRLGGNVRWRKGDILKWIEGGCLRPESTNIK